jgi:hypothetical protein
MYMSFCILYSVVYVVSFMYMSFRGPPLNTNTERTHITLLRKGSSTYPALALKGETGVTFPLTEGPTLQDSNLLDKTCFLKYQHNCTILESHP